MFCASLLHVSTTCKLPRFKTNSGFCSQTKWILTGRQEDREPLLKQSLHVIDGHNDTMLAHIVDHQF